jgi:hypothetical protein
MVPSTLFDEVVQLSHALLLSFLHVRIRSTPFSNDAGLSSASMTEVEAMKTNSVASLVNVDSSTLRNRRRSSTRGHEPCVEFRTSLEMKHQAVGHRLVTHSMFRMHAVPRP